MICILIYIIISNYSKSFKSWWG